ncbi:cyclin-dependent kinase-like 4 [Anoplophora glabripennis]|uniref:cyclin-dependent kinase-like 4 n=1 Tax=Anoplophora glabripennis TaxID=217634 RepID=UPI0008754AE3|nr:cyclin-dependent kinase-like 4 [Anoplophora glabripennis]
MEKYEQLSVVGEGSYGIVMKCRHLPTNQIVAVKKFLETEEDASNRKVAIREIRLLKRLKHENLVTMIEAFRHRKRFYLVFEFVDGTLMDELERAPLGLGEQKSRERIFQVLRAISYCHKNRIVHRDIKPENILVSSKGLVKICDFGFARILSVSRELCTQYVATRWYRAPELLVGERYYGTPVDIWAIGCLFAEMMTGEPLFPGKTDIDQLHLIVKVLGKPCSRHQKLLSKNSQLRTKFKGKSDTSIDLNRLFYYWPLPTINFLDKCLKMDPHKRFIADELLKHVFFTADQFPTRFLITLREMVEIEFNSPLLKSFKHEVLRSTDKADSVEQRKMQQIPSLWSITLKDNSLKRKLFVK